MLVLDAFKGHLTLDIKATITGSSMNTALDVILGEYDCKSAGARCLQKLYNNRIYLFFKWFIRFYTITTLVSFKVLTF